MKLLNYFLTLLLLFPAISLAEEAIIEGEYRWYDARYIDTGIRGGYTGFIDIQNQTGAFSSTEPFNGAYWTADVSKIYIYNEHIGGTQNFSWDITFQTWFDLQTFSIIQCYENDNACNNIDSTNAIFLGSETHSHPFVMNQPGQFAIATFISWFSNEFPVLMTLQSDNNVLNPSQTSFTSFDGDNNGIPGYAMITAPFPHQTLAISGYIGSIDGIFLSDINIVGGNRQECTTQNGSNVSLSVDVTVNNDSISKVEWFLNNSLVGNTPAIDIFAPIGNNQLTVIATAVSGKTASANTSLTILDTTPPEMQVTFTDSKTGDNVNIVDRNGLTRLKTNYLATDICDPSPSVTATGGFNIANEAFLPVNVLNDSIILNISEMTISAISSDASGNTTNSTATLTIQ